MNCGQTGMQMAAEGVWNCRAACKLGDQMGISLPIAEQVYAVVHEGLSAQDAMTALMGRALARSLNEILGFAFDNAYLDR